jgi:hypothetical protein
MESEDLTRCISITTNIDQICVSLDFMVWFPVVYTWNSKQPAAENLFVFEVQICLLGCAAV